jgi:hypothetical protein
VFASLLGVQPRHTRYSPIFVLGHSRSGTSLMCRLLLDHLGVNFGTESQFIVRYHQRLARYGDLRDERRLRVLLEDLSRERFFARTRQNFGFVFDIDRAMQSIESPSYPSVLRAIFAQFADSQGKARWGDKTPEYCHHLPLIRSLFPDAQFVHVIRDGRAVARSLFDTGFGPKNAYEAALDWKRTIGEITRFRDTLAAGSYIELRYEDLLEDPLRMLTSVAGFLGIENHAEVMAVTGGGLRAYVRGQNAGKWKHQLTWREIECFEAFAGDELRALGYPLQFRPRNVRLSAAEALFWQAQGVWRRLGNRRYWADNWYKLGLRIRDARPMLRSLPRPRPLAPRRAAAAGR